MRIFKFFLDGFVFLVWFCWFVFVDVPGISQPPGYLSLPNSAFLFASYHHLLLGGFLGGINILTFPYPILSLGCFHFWSCLICVFFCLPFSLSTFPDFPPKPILLFPLTVSSPSLILSKSKPAPAPLLLGECTPRIFHVEACAGHPP